MVHFRRPDMWVAPRSVAAYARWVLTRDAAALNLRSMLGGARIALQQPSEVQELLERGGGLGVSPGWLRASSDGTRTQMFDRRGRTVAHLPIGECGRRRMRAELWARRRAGDLAPRVLRRDAAQGYVEERLAGQVSHASRDVLVKTLQALESRFYRPRPVSFRRYVRLIGRFVGLDALDREAIAWVEEAGLAHRDVIVSWVHGDLWPANIFVDGTGSVRVSDWEYARMAALTSDAWHYLYQCARWKRQPRESFLAELSEVFAARWGIRDAREVRAKHILHLVERRNFLKSIVAAGEQPLIEHMGGEIRRELACREPDASSSQR